VFPEEAGRVREARRCCWVAAPLCSDASGRARAAMGRGQGLCHGAVLTLSFFLGSRMNHHHYGCQTPHPPVCEPCSLMPKLAEIGWGSCKAGGIALHLSSEEHPDQSHYLAGAWCAPAWSPWLRASLPGKLSSAAPGASHHGTSIAQTLKVIKDPTAWEGANSPAKGDHAGRKVQKGKPKRLQPQPCLVSLFRWVFLGFCLSSSPVTLQVKAACG